MPSEFPSKSTQELHEQLKQNPRKKAMLSAYKERLFSLSEKQFQIGIALMLGDGSLQTQNGGKTFRMKFEQSNKHRDYLSHLYSEFSEWCLNDIRQQLRTNDQGNEVETFAFQTISHSAFVPLAKIFSQRTDFNEKNTKKTETIKKSLTQDFVQDYVTATVMAYWFMDDGGKMDYTANEGKGIVFNSHNFSEKENNYLVNGLKSKFHLDSWVKRNKGKYVVAVSGVNYSQMMELIGDLVIPSMREKLPSPRREKQSQVDDIV